MKRLLSIDPEQRETMRAELVSNVNRVRADELRRLLETASFFAQLWHGASFLLVDRTQDPAVTHISACIDGTMTDLWELNPILWDDAAWAGARLVDNGQWMMVKPVLHRD
jgi:hypothetical protein